jgi:hypothetical protein
MFAETQARYIAPGSGIAPDIEVYDADSSYNITAGKVLLGILVEPTANLAAFKVGSAPGLGDYLPESPVTSADGMWVQLNIYAKADTNIYLGGITSTTTVQFFKI